MSADTRAAAHQPRRPLTRTRSLTRTTPLTGTWVLFGTILRRDRLRTVAWVAGIGLAGFYFAHAVQVLAESEQELKSLAGLYADPVGRMMVGPGFGMDEPTYERFFASGYVLFIYILMALFSIFTITRHTRAEEQTGRAELVRSNVVGRHATLTAALMVTVMVNVFSAGLVAVAALSAGYDLNGSLLTAAAGFGVGIFFCGISAVAAQLSEASRGASGIGGGLLAAAYLIRMGGDTAEIGGSALSWFSPLGWSQQTAPYVHDLWWPVALLLGSGVLFAALGYWLSTTRDLEASLLPNRLGRAQARPVLGTSWGLAARTLRGGLWGWGTALVLTGLLFGGYAQAMIDAADDLPPELAQIFAGEDIMLGYMAYMAVFMAVFVAAAGVSGISQLRGEETGGRAEFALSAPMSRLRWLGSHLSVLVVGLILILGLVGVGMGLGAAAVLERDGGQYFVQLLLAGVLQGPTVLAVVGLVTVCFGWVPRAAAPVGWLVVGFGAALTTFGSLLELPNFVTTLNVFGHLAEYPVQDAQWGPMFWLSTIGAAGLILGLIGWSRRQVNTV